MKKLIIAFIVLFAGFQARAQQDHHYTQFMYNKLMVNPAYAGSRGVPTITGIYRMQWIGFQGAPQSVLASFHSPFLSKRVGIGVTISHLKIGLDRDLRATLAYSYDMIAQDNVSMRVGIMGSLRSLGMDFASAEPLTIGDPSLEDERINDIYGNVGAGVYGTFYNRLYVGFSAPRIYSNVIGISSGNTTALAKESPHFYGMVGGVLNVGEGLNLLPAVLLKYVKNAPFDADINLNLEIREKFTAGLSYRMGGDGPGDSVDFLVYWQAAPQFGVGASYDFTLSRLRNNTVGTIEVMAQADLKKQSKKMSNPRFFM